VSGGLLEAICRARGAQFSRTHTGFKWIARRARALTERQGLRFVFGYEEAIGYAFGALGDDKDGLAALYVLCALTRSLAERAQRLTDLLDQLARSHGLYASQQLTIQADPASAVPSARALFEGLRRHSDAALLGPHATRQDYSEGPNPVPLLVIQDPTLRLCVRPSGTEPKLKLYLHGRMDVAPAESLAQARARLDAQLAELGRRLALLLREDAGSQS
jgi:phosphomannomutase